MMHLFGSLLQALHDLGLGEQVCQGCLLILIAAAVESGGLGKSILLVLDQEVTVVGLRRAFLVELARFYFAFVEGTVRFG